MTHDHAHHDHHDAETVVDPVCGMAIDPTTTQHRSAFDGVTYYFCGPGCKAAFDADPSTFVGGDAGHGAGSGHGHH